MKISTRQVPTPISKNAILQSETNEIPTFFELNPNNQAVAPKPTWLPESPHYNITNERLNERYEYSIEKPKKTFRIITLGDSFTFGWNVDVDKNYSEVLEDMLNNKAICHENNHYDVINLGVPNYDIAFSVERFLKRGKKYNPDLIVFYITNDFKQYLEKEIAYQRNCEKNIIPNTEKNTLECWDKAHEYATNMISDRERESYQLQWLEYLTKVFDGPIILMTSTNKLVSDFSSVHNNTIYFNGVDSVSKSDTLSFRKYKDAHPSIQGHEFIANQLFTLLNDRRLLRCSNN